MTRRRITAILASILLVAAGALVPAEVGSASSSNDLAYGLIVKYQAGVSPLDSSGAPTGESFSKVDLSSSEPLGLGYYSLPFAQPLGLQEATNAAKAIAEDPRILTSELNLELGKSSYVFKNPKQVLRSKSSVPAASPVRTLMVVDAWNEAAPAVAQAVFTWQKPLNLYAAKVIGYKIESSFDGIKWSTVIRNTKSSHTSYVLSSGLTPGAKYRFRVRAITQREMSTNVGAPSAEFKISFATAPMPPMIRGLNSASVNMTGPLTVHWDYQTRSEKGGLPVTYKVIARAPGQPDLTCTTTTFGCDLTAAVASAVYHIHVVATNTRGFAVSSDSGLPTDPNYSKQWYLTAQHGVSAERAWAISKGSDHVVVAVLDTGITQHPELNDSIVSGYDFVDNDTDATDPGDGIPAINEPSSWHGTHVAGIIAAKWNNEGIAGLAPNVKIQPVRILGSGGEGTTSNLIRAINWASGLDISGVPKNKTPAKVINLSLASLNSCNTLGSLQDTISSAFERNVTIVSAAGNDASDNRFYSPTGCWHPISVGASGFSGDRAYYSNYNVDIMAPGGDDKVSTLDPNVPNLILSTYNSGAYAFGAPSYEAEEGTSMAAPVVSAIIALLYSYNPNLSADAVSDALIQNTTPFAAGSWCAQHTGSGITCGAGIANAGKALEYLVASDTRSK